jgi:hypothetical protein
MDTAGRSRIDRARGSSWLAPNLRTYVGVAVVASLATLVAVEQLFYFLGGMYGWYGGSDFDLYIAATHRWLSGGDFYPAVQTAGAYVLEYGAILYPPQMLALFVPFTVMPAVLWWIIPTVATAWIVAGYRPGPWTFAVMLLPILAWPLTVLTWWSGTPTIWFVMFVALATRWPMTSALILAKPTLLPFALLGVRRRAWWLILAVGLVTAVIAEPLTVQWVMSMVNARGPMVSPLYSVDNVPLMMMPVTAWIGWRRSRPRQPRLNLPSEVAAVG